MTKNKPKKDGSGRGIRANRGRGGCDITKEEGQGYNQERKSKTPWGFRYS